MSSFTPSTGRVRWQEGTSECPGLSRGPKRTTTPSKSPSVGSTTGIRRMSFLSVTAARYSPLAAPVRKPPVVDVAPLTGLWYTISTTEKSICERRMSTPGTTMIKARRTNTYETRPLILRTLRGAITTLQRAWGMIRRDGRRPEHSISSPLHPLLPLQKGKTVHAEQVVADMVDEVLARQAAVRARRSGESLEDALDAVVRSEAGRQLQELREGPHGSERAVEWQENLVRSRAEARVALITDTSFREEVLSASR